MISKDIIEAFSDLAKDRSVDRTNLGTIIEDLFLNLIQKKYGEERENFKENYFDQMSDQISKKFAEKTVRSWEEYKNNISEDTRIQECSRILNKHPNRVPIIVCKDKNCTLLDIDKQKYLVPQDMNLGQFIYVIRKRIKLQPNEALFVLVNNSLMPSNKSLQEVYESNKDTDGFLYIVYSSENTFG